MRRETKSVFLIEEKIYFKNKKENVGFKIILISENSHQDQTFTYKNNVVSRLATTITVK